MCRKGCGQNEFYNLCFEILKASQYIPEIVPVLKDIQDGREFERNFPQTIETFFIHKNEIISYIRKVRVGNIVDAFKNEEGSLALITAPNGRPLTELSPQELYNNLDGEIYRLLVKGMYHLIMHYFPMADDRKIMQDLFSKDVQILIKYGLLKG